MAMMRLAASTWMALAATLLAEAVWFFCCFSVRSYEIEDTYVRAYNKSLSRDREAATEFVRCMYHMGRYGLGVLYGMRRMQMNVHGFLCMCRVLSFEPLTSLVFFFFLKSRLWFGVTINENNEPKQPAVWFVRFSMLNFFVFGQSNKVNWIHIIINMSF